jgi:hypothetical protein
MDDHFKVADFDQNMPVVLALLAYGTIIFWGGERSVDPLYAISSKLLLIYNRDNGEVMVKCG